MDEPLEERYFQWLYSQIGSVKQRNRARTYWRLAKQLHDTEFVWFVPNDDNRAEDGKELRYEFLHHEGTPIGSVDIHWREYGCSMLEMLIALSRRLSFNAEGEPLEWFWILVDKHLGIRFNDREWSVDAETEVLDTLEVLNWRKYKPSGEGGLFPLQHPNKDQRKVEIWYQMSAYLIEQM